MNRGNIIHLVLTILFLGYSINLTRTTFEMLKNKNRVRELASEVATLDSRVKDINDSIEYKKTDEFVEEFARNELNLIKPGEDVLVLTTTNLQNSSDDKGSAILSSTDSKINANEPKNEVKEPNVFSKWLSLFF